MNIIARLEYELAYYDSAVHRFNHYTTRTPRMVVRLRRRQSKTQIIFDCIRQHDLELNQSKCVFLTADLIYLGQNITSEGLKFDPSKIEIIVKITNLITKKSCNVFLARATNVDEFPKTPKSLLHSTLQNDIEWLFAHPQQKSIDNLKDMLTNQS